MPEDQALQQSLLSWMFAALGLPYVILLSLAGGLCFLFALVLVLRGKGPMAAASLVLVVHVPFFIGILGAIQGAIACYLVIASSADAPKPSEMAEGISSALVAALVGMIAMVPAYTTAVLGAFIRALTAKNETSNLLR